MCDCGPAGSGGGGAGGAGTGGAAEPAAPDTSVGIWAMVNGELEGGRAPNVSPLMDMNNQFLVNDGLGLAITVWWPGAPSAGTYPCVSNTLPGGSRPESRGAGVSYDIYYWSWATGGSCTLTITELGTQSGARVAGTFSGVLPGNPNATPPPDPPSVTITEGRFAVQLP